MIDCNLLNFYLSVMIKLSYLFCRERVGQSSSRQLVARRPAQLEGKILVNKLMCGLFCRNFLNSCVKTYRNWFLFLVNNHQAPIKIWLSPCRDDNLIFFGKKNHSIVLCTSYVASRRLASNISRTEENRTSFALEQPDEERDSLPAFFNTKIRTEIMPCFIHQFNL